MMSGPKNSGIEFKTLVLGASPKPNRYSYLAVKKLLASGIEVIAIGSRPSEIEGVTIHPTPVATSNVHTVTLYLNPKNQVQYYRYILSLKPKRIIFNPGTENPELTRKATQQGIQCIEGCTLVMLSNNLYFNDDNRH